LPNLVESMQGIAMRAYLASQPTAVVFGVVTSASPLKIKIDQKLTLEDDHLLLTSSVRDYEVEMTVDHVTESAGDVAHTHAYAGKKAFTVHNSLKAGENVMLIRQQGGQKYVVLDRLVTI
jgi:hypothetical protein